MKTQPGLSVVTRSFILFFSCLSTVYAAGYTITDLGTLGGENSWATDINDNGHVVGSSEISGSTDRHAFLFDGNTMHDLGTLGGTYSLSDAINNNGEVTGWSYTAGDIGVRETHPFFYDGNTMHDLGTLGGKYAAGNDINDNGQITGYSYVTEDSYSQHAFYYDGNSMQDIGTLGGDRSFGNGINAAGWITGHSELTPGDHSLWHAFVYDGNSLHDIGTLGGNWSFGVSINDSNQITGYSQTANDGTHAFYYDGNTMQDIGTLGGTDSRASDINNLGYIVGNSNTYSGTSVAYLYDGSSMLNLCVLTDCSSQGWSRLNTASAINNRGDIVGHGEINGVSHAYLIRWNDQAIVENCIDGIDNDHDSLIDCDDTASCSQYPICYKPTGMDYGLIDLGTLGGNYSAGRSINNNRQVTGESRVTVGSYSSHAFLYSNDAMLDLGTLASQTDSIGYGVNDSGEVAGESFNFLSISDQAFLHDGSSIFDLHSLFGAPCNIVSGARDINNNGYVTGYCSTYIDYIWGHSIDHVFLYDGNNVHDLGTLGGESAFGHAINDFGHITGDSEYTTTSNTRHAFLYNGQSMTDLGTLGGYSSYGRDINNSDQITGWSYTADDYRRAFLYTNNTMLDLGTLGGEHSSGLGINEAGQVVGNTSLATGENAAFLYDSNRMLFLCAITECTDKGWHSLTSATDINDHGDITGYGVINGETHAFLALANVDVTPTAPITRDDQVDVLVDTVTVINVIANDTDFEDGSPPPVPPADVTLLSSTSQQGFPLVDNGDGSITYTPSGGYEGGDSFEYTLSDSDGMVSSVATVTINISSTPINQPPVCTDVTLNTLVNSTLSININNQLLSGCSDPDSGDSVSLESYTSPVVPGSSLTPSGSKKLIYTPATDFIGNDSFTYTVTDGQLTSTYMVTVQVLTDGTVNQPPVANDDQASIHVDTVTVLNVIGNDTDAEDGAPLPAPPAVVTPTASTSSLGFALLANADGTITYSPSGGYVGIDEFQYTVTDSGGATSLPGTVTINITASPDNHTPVCNDVSLHIDINTALSIDVNNELLSTCVDQDSTDIINLISFSQPSVSESTLQYDGFNHLIYTPAPEFSGIDTFTYTAGDGTDTDTRTVTVTISSVDDDTRKSSGALDLNTLLFLLGYLIIYRYRNLIISRD